MDKILVTGGAGFIGSHLVKRLVSDGYEVVVLDKLLRGNKLEKDILNQIELVHGDVRDRDLVHRLVKGCRYVYHFAAVLGVDIVADNPVETMETEVIGMKHIGDAAILNGIEKVIYASTSGVYGHSAIEKSVTETIQIDPRTSYAIAKRYNEIYLAALGEEKGLQSISLRFFNVYGTAQDTRMVIPRFFHQALMGKPITVFGNGEQTRDFTYIDDTITACYHLANQVKGAEIFNIANEQEITIKDLAFAIKEITNSSSEIQFIEAPKKRYDFEVERRIGSSAKLKAAVDYQPSTQLKEGLGKLVAYYEEEFSAKV
ncbi:MAG: NAD-dependent epimerase/dehydratase family protein [Salibacteraceae bacterium]